MKRIKIAIFFDLSVFHLACSPFLAPGIMGVMGAVVQWTVARSESPPLFYGSEQKWAPSEVSRVAGVRLRTPARGLGDRGPETDPSHPTPVRGRRVSFRSASERGGVDDLTVGLRPQSHPGQL